MDPGTLTHSPLRAIIADPDDARRGWLKDALRADPRLTVVAAVGDGAEAAELARHYRPDVLLCGHGLPGKDATALIAMFAVAPAEVRVLVLSDHGDESWAVEALRAGASAVVDLSLPEDALAATVVQAASGHSTLPSGVALQLIERLREAPVCGQGLRPIHSDLSNREWQVMDLLISGASTREVADTLFVAEDTVYSHIKHVMRKLGVRTRADAVAAARRLYAVPALVAA